VRLFVDYANAHPEKLNLPAAAVAYNAMADAFPCK
jgi:Rap1a immunity proteins